MSNNCKEYLSFGVCTGHGICMNNGQCKCDEGWTSIGDFSSVYGDHCGINILAIRILWIINLIPYPFIVYLSIKVVKSRIQRTQQQQTSSSSKEQVNGNQYQSPPSSFVSVLLSKDLVVLFPIFLLIASIFGLFLALLKIIDPSSYAISLHPATTSLYYLFTLFAVFGACIYLHILVNFMSSYAKMMPTKIGNTIKRNSEIVKNVAKATGVMIPFTYFTLYINILRPEHDYECMVGYSIASNWVLLFVGGTLARYHFIIAREIEKHLNDKNSELVRNTNQLEKFMAVKNKMDSASKVIYLTVIFSVIYNSMFIIFPFLAKNSSYLIPASIISFQRSFVSLELNVLLETENKKTNTSDVHPTRPASNNYGGTSNLVAANSFSASKPVSPSSENQVTVIDGMIFDQASNMRVSARIVSATSADE